MNIVDQHEPNEEEVSTPAPDGWVERPWGGYVVVHRGNGYQVKILSVKPGEQLSLQLHRRRREHWVALAGRAIAQVGDNTVELNPGDEIAIPLGARHRLGNPGRTMLEVVESQFGDYLGEDDIERFEDQYGRC